MKVGIVGAGKLGFPVALAIESKGHEVAIYDVRKDYVMNILETRNYPHKERHVDELLAKSKIKFKELSELVRDSEIIFIAVQTPHDPRYEGITPLPRSRKDFDYKYLKRAVRDVSREVKKLGEDRIVVIISTVLPNTIEKHILPIINKHVKLCYNPFFIAMGVTIDDFLNPEFVLFGVRDKEALDKAKEFYRTITDAPFYECSIKEAEAIKVLYNTFIGFKIAFANMVGEMSHKLHINSDTVLNALKLAKVRLISPSYLNAGMGDGGACLPPDTEVLTEHGYKPIKDIQIGEKVLAHDGMFHRVVKRYVREYHGDLIVVTPYGNTSKPIKATPEHPVYVIRPPNKEPEFIPISELNINDILLLPITKRVVTCVVGNKPIHTSSQIENDYSHIPIKTIMHEHYDGYVYNLEVEEAHSYTLRRCIVHNCHPRDNIALSYLAKKLKLSKDLFTDIMKARENHARWLASLILEYLNDGYNEAWILGKAYKPESNLTYGSPSILLYNILKEQANGNKDSIHIYDPYIDGEQPLPNKPCVFFIGTKHEEFKEYGFPRGSVILDPFGYIPKQEGLRVIWIGREYEA